MDESTLQLFSRQLAAWAEAAIEHGRSPFRKVETFPRLVTELGEQRPPLVFWINRDSCMAGGVVVFPSEPSGDELEKGRACARALGLKHVVGWAPREIVFWELLEASLSRHKTIDLSDSSHPSRFRDALLAVMEELKILSVLGAVPPERLSAHYLANLCVGTALAALPSLTEAFRLARGDDLLESNAPPAELAEWKSAMTLLRLLGLVLHDRLPPTVQPEGLERAMVFALEALCDECRSALEMPQDELPLPEESAVVFHHLFRRLTQLGLQADRSRSIGLLELLFEQNSRSFHGRPLPEGAAADEGDELLLHPDRLLLRGEPLLVAEAPLLACTVLGRTLSGLPPLRLQTSDLFTLTPEAAPSRVRGTLEDESVPTGPRRRNLAARLRLSWPARRFPLGPRTPAWLWELLHTLGIAGPECRLELVVPASWPTAEFGIPLMEVLREQFCLEGLALRGRHLHMRLRKTRSPHGAITLAGPQGERRLSWGENGVQHPALLPLALHLPGNLFSLLEREVLVPPGEATPLDSRGLGLFCRSSLGRLLWNLVSDNRPLPPEQQLPEEIRRRGMPLPDAGILASLCRLAPEKSTPPGSRQLDEELALWLGQDLFAPPPRSDEGRGRQAIPSRRSAPQQSGPSAEEIAAEVFVDGLPRFPEQYLYDYYRPQLEEYRFTGPLTPGDEFFGRHQLRDRQGNTLEIEGEETARALLLASFGGRQPVALPVDRRLTAAILERYLADLRALRRKLLREVHLRTAGGRAAENLAKKIWQAHSLPPWGLIET